MILVGLVGSKGVGKDACATFFGRQGYEKLTFADPLKQAAQAIFCLPYEAFHDQSLKEEVVQPWGKSPRQLMQLFGTDIMRKHFDENIWIENMKMRLGKTGSTKVVVSDVRFTNEAKLIKDMGGILIRIVRPGHPTDKDHHVSETESTKIDCDRIIVNGGSLLELSQRVSDEIKSLDKVVRRNTF